MRKLIRLQLSKILAVGDQLIVSGTNFSVGLLVTRFMGLETYGQFVLYWMIFLFLQGLFLAFIGLPMLVLSSAQPNKDAYFKNSFKMANLLLVHALGILYPVFHIYKNINPEADFGYGFWLFPLLVVLFVKHEINRKYYYAKGESEGVVLIDLFTYFAQIPVLMILIYLGKTDINVLIATMVACVTVGNLIFLAKEGKIAVGIGWSNLPWIQNWKYARYLLLTAILQWFSGNVLLISAGGILGVAAVGIIRVLQNIMGVLHVLFLTLENVVPVKASFLLVKHSKKHMFTYLKKVTLITGIVYGLLLLTLKLSGKWILGTLYGAQYEQYNYLLDAFILVYVLIFIGTLAQIVIKTLQLNHSIFIAYVFSVLAAFLIAAPLVNAFDLMGVIIGFGILQLITISIYFLTLKRKL